MRLRSSAFEDKGQIPRRFTCDGEDVSPPLQWSAAPGETKSFALLCDDPDAPAGVWRHWAAYDIPGDRASLDEDESRFGASFKQAINDFRRLGYGGPCPPHGHGPHHYRFRLLALDIAALSVPENADCAAVEAAARKHALAEARLTGVYER